MKVTEALSTTRDTLTVKRVFAEPYERDGITLIAAAAVLGGAGGGHGTDPKGQEGEGGGYAVHARPVGAYILENGRVAWRPALDLNRLLTLLGVVALAFVLRRPRSGGSVRRASADASSDS
ncbi:hypothetical protein [uncultured Phycicoccus sp.]|uniref:hypothetical protein n=1 Tax=uncultured Phycicoccus sp. TaxID=661422 RepID=UPI002632229E|nr:hypothetical protein [uncultured Phycicoccus sp.]